MRLCNNGRHTPDNFEELLQVLSWNLETWDEKEIEGVKAGPSRGVLANSGGFAHAKIVVYLPLQSRHAASLVVALKAPFSHDGSRENLFVDLTLRVSSPGEYNFYFREAGSRHLDTMTLRETFERIRAQRATIEGEFLRGGSLDTIEWFSFCRGFVRFAFLGSFRNQERDAAFLKTMPKAIAGECQGVSKTLAVSIYMSYSFSCSE